MAAVALDQYLASVLKSNITDKNEVKLEAGNPDFDLFTIYLENHNTGIHAIAWMSRQSYMSPKVL